MLQREQINCEQESNSVLSVGIKGRICSSFPFFTGQLKQWDAYDRTEF